MRSRISHPIQAAASIIIVMLICFWGARLIVSSNKARATLDANLVLAAKLNDLERSIRNLERLVLEDSRSASDEVRHSRWETSLSDFHSTLQAFGKDGSATPDLNGALDRIRASVAALDRLGVEELGRETDPVFAAAMQATALREINHALEEQTRATEVARQSLAASASSLAGRWRDLSILVLVACVLAILLYTYQRYIVRLERAQEALRASERRYRLLFERNLAGVSRRTIDGKVLDCNDAFARLLGLRSPEEIKGQQICSFYQNSADHTALIENLQRAGAVTNFETCFKRNDGTLLWVIESASLLKDYDTSSAVVEGTMVDITERKDELRQSQKMAAIGRLAAGVSHDFSNLITVIIGYCGVMLDVLPKGDGMRTTVEEIQNAGQQAATLTRQLLAFGRDQVLQPTVFDLNALITETEGLLRRAIGENVLLAKRLEPGLGAIEADTGQVEQILMNLAINAGDAMPQGGRLTIETGNVSVGADYALSHPEVAPGHYVVMAVSDTGRGMDPETMEHIFEPFYATKGDGVGTGLGLSTVYGIVLQSGGHIFVESELGRGTTFRIYMPRAQAVIQPAPVQTDKANNSSATETVLVVEDDEFVRRMTCETLRRKGYNVLESSHGFQALTTCQQLEGPIDLMVTDVAMPQMSGYELAERIAPFRPGMKILFTSGYNESGLAQFHPDQPIGHFLAKPFTPRALQAKVQELLA